MTCVFCTNLPSAGELIFETDDAWVLLHPDWSPKGHAMVVAKRHLENVSALGEDEWLNVARTWHRAERAILDATGAERAIILKLGIMTPHLHVHIYPARATDTRDDVFAAIDGKRGEARDPDFVKLLTRGLR